MTSATLRAWILPAVAVGGAVAFYFLSPTPMPGGNHCLFLTERCAAHAHEREPDSAEGQKRICPCEDLVNQGCLRKPASVDGPSRVEQACAEVNLPSLHLVFQDEKQNRERIAAAPSTNNRFAEYLKQVYRRGKAPTEGTALLAIANGANQQFLPDSALKATSLKFASTASREANREAYLTEFLALARAASPRLAQGIESFLTFKHPLVKRSVIRVADKGELKEPGGRYRTKESGDGKTVIREITLSPDSSASLPGQFTTLFHELQHAETFAPQPTPTPGSTAFAEAELVEEARAYEAQMQLYLELVKGNPEFYCHWLTVASRYGNVVVPLGWMMAAVERELKSGQFLAREAGRWDSKDLLVTKQGRLRPDLQGRLQSMGFEYAH